MADVQILAPGQVSAPLDYLVPGAQEILVKNLSAKFDGSAASVTWQPAITLIAPGGKEIGTFPLTNALAAGASADVSFFPGVRNPSSSSPGSSDIFWPAADQADASYDKTTYPNNYTGTGNYDTLVFTTNGGPSAAIAIHGEDFPRFIQTPNLGDSGHASEVGVFMNDGTADPLSTGAGFQTSYPSGAGNAEFVFFNWSNVVGGTGIDTHFAHTVLTLFNGMQLAKAQGNTGADPIMSSGHGVPAIGGNVSDLYWRNDGAAGTFLYRCSDAGNAGDATWVGIL